MGVYSLTPQVGSSAGLCTFVRVVKWALGETGELVNDQIDLDVLQ